MKKPSVSAIGLPILILALCLLTLDHSFAGRGEKTALSPAGAANQEGATSPALVRISKPSARKTAYSRPARVTTREDNAPPGEDLWTRRKWLGDFDRMVKRRLIRVLVPPSRTFFFVDRGKKQGLTYDTLMLFERDLNKKLKTRHLRVKVLVIPTSRNRLLTDLVAGYGDIAAGNLTITPGRAGQVDFSDPLLTGVNEIVVSRPDAPPLRSLFDLSGRRVFVRRSSSYYESLSDLNHTLKSMRKPPVRVIPADEYLEDEDLLEMLNAGLLSLVVVDDTKARFWAGIFPHIRLHPDIKLRTGGRIGWAMRKGSPRLKQVINDFVRRHKKGTLHGNILYRRYLEQTGYIKNNISARERKKYEQTVSFFRKYGREYGFPFLLLTALAYQESGLDQHKRSAAGAIGIMQVLPSTARDKNINIPGIHKLENNIHAGTKYLAFMKKRYFSSSDLDELNSDLFTIAAYNAGPARINQLRREAARRGLDPNVWFNNVEVVAAARIGRETVRYVDNIYKYYVAYKQIYQQEQRKKVGKSILEHHFSAQQTPGQSQP